MAQIDKFIEALHRSAADDLDVAVNAKVTLGVNGERRPATSQQVTLAQVEQLLKEIMPPDVATPEGADGPRFTYNAPSGAVQVSVSRAQGSLRLLITPLPRVGDAERVASHVNGGEPASVRQPPGSNTEVATPGASTVSAGRARIDGLFMTMIEAGCSDLHISSGSLPLFRKDGDIVALDDDGLVTAEGAKELLLSITPPHNREEFERRNDTDFAHEIPGVARFRCNLFMDRLGMGGVFRVIPTDILTVEDLGLPQSIVELCHLPKGLVLVTGPTGSGKSTTLAALIDYINRNRTDHIITIEDPIEFVHTNKRCLINQREIGVHTQSFKIALRAALREDPDVVLVGEMRDLETVAIAIETAETGHLVFGTLHTNTAPSTVDRIIDQFPADEQSQIRAMLSESLKGVIAQTLLKAKNGGRVAALEYLLVNPAVANLIREGKTFQIPGIMQTGKAAGMQQLNDAFLALVKSGRVAPEEACRRAANKAEFEALLSRNGVALRNM